MTRSTKTLLIIAGICAAAGVALGAAALAVGGPSAFRSIHRSVDMGFGTVDVNIGDGQFSIGASASSGLDSEYSASGEYTVTESITAVEVEWLSGRVEFIPGGDSVTFTESSESPIGKKDALKWGVVNGVLKIYYCSGIAYDLPAKDITIYIPTDTAARLSYIDCGSTSADVTLSGFSLHRVEADSVSGDIRISGCDIGRFEADSTSGGIELTDCIVSELEAETTSGSVILGLDVCPGTLDISTVSGDVSVSLPPDSGFTLEADTTSGDISLDFAARMRGGEYIVGDGKSSFEFDSVSGSLSVTER